MGISFKYACFEIFRPCHHHSRLCHYCNGNQMYAELWSKSEGTCYWQSAAQTLLEDHEMEMSAISSQ
jgi:hypothetical protein